MLYFAVAPAEKVNYEIGQKLKDCGCSKSNRTAGEHDFLGFNPSEISPAAVKSHNGLTSEGYSDADRNNYSENLHDDTDDGRGMSVP